MGIMIESLNRLRVDTEARRKLDHYAKSMRKGSDVDYRSTAFSVYNDQTALFDDNSRISGVHDRRPISRKLIIDAFKPKIYSALSDYPNILKFEQMFEKYTLSSRSIELPGRERVSKFKESYTNQDLELEIVKRYPNKYKEGFRLTTVRFEQYIRQYIKKHSLRPYGIDRAIDRMEKTTQYGFPFLLQGRIYKDNMIIQDNIPKYRDIALKMIEKIVNKQFIPTEGRCFGILTRLQEGPMVNGKGTTKNREVGGDAHAATMLGGIGYPLLDACARMPVRKILIGLDELDKQLIELVNSSHPHYTILSADQTAFDNHIRGDIVREYLVPIIMDSFYGSDSRLKAALEGYLTEHMGEDPAVCPDGVYYGKHGMPSGSLYTNEIDSGYQLGHSMLINVINGEDIYVPIAIQGDDGGYLIKESKEHAAQRYSKDCALLNLKSSDIKNYVSDNEIILIKRYGGPKLKHGYRSKLWSLVGEINMERPKDGKEYMYEARGGSILCNHYLTDPGISDFFMQISLGYQYLLGLTDRNGYYTILQQAGGVQKVSRRLDLDSYANHLGTTHVKERNAGVLSVSDLTIMKWQKEARDKPIPKSWVQIG